MRRMLAVTLAVVVVAACGFPDENFVAATTDASSGSSSGGDARGEGGGSSGGEAGGDANMPSDSSSGADSPMNDASSERDAPTIDTYIPDVFLDVSPDSPQCDQDGDGFDRPECPGGNDCCDFDKMAFPGQTMFFPVEDVCHSFDYNCNTKDDPEYPPFACTPGVTGCTTFTPGYVGGAVACGTSGPFAGTCKNQITSCQAASTMPQVQACN